MKFPRYQYCIQHIKTAGGTTIRRLLIMLCLLLLPVCGLAESPFVIDEINLYSGMNRNYMQGYAPTVSNNTLTIVLPLVSDVIEGDITALVEPSDLVHGPFKLQSFEKEVSRQTYTFDGMKVSAYRIQLALALHKDRVNGEYPFTITVTGKDAGGNLHTQAFPMEAIITDGMKSQAPTLAISQVKTNGEWLVAGENDTLHFTLSNLSPYRAAENVTIEFTDASGDILPQGSSTIRVERIPVLGECQIAIPLQVIPKATTGAHIATFKTSYSDSSNSVTVLTEEITIDVRQSVRFAHSDPLLSPRVSQGDIPTLSITLMNMGKSTLYNVLMTTNLPGLSSGGSVLVGEIESGKSANGSANFKVDTSVLGDVEGQLLLTYEDEYGQKYEETLPLKTTIIEKAAAPSSLTEKEEKEKPIALWISWGISALLLIALIIQSLRLTRKIHALEERNL